LPPLEVVGVDLAGVAVSAQAPVDVWRKKNNAEAELEALHLPWPRRLVEDELEADCLSQQRRGCRGVGRCWSSSERLTDWREEEERCAWEVLEPAATLGKMSGRSTKLRLRTLASGEIHDRFCVFSAAVPASSWR
jgi:hypothetical protein